jgi:Fe-S oxidoreductase
MKVRDLGTPRPPDEPLSPIRLDELAPLPAPYDAIDPASLWKELSAGKKDAANCTLDGVCALNLKRPADAMEEERLVEGFKSGLRKLLSEDDNWAFLQPLALTLENCTHCQTCAEECPIFVGSGHNEAYRPTVRADALRRLAARFGPGGNRLKGALAGELDLNADTVLRLAELAYRCTLCRRCTQACPIGVDNGLVAHELRKLFSMEMGIAPPECHEKGSVLQLEVGSTTGMSPAVVRDNVEFIDDEIREKTGLNIKTPFDKEGADVLLLHNAGEIMAWPENPGAFAVILEAAGVSWTLSSDLLGYDGVNYGLWYDDVQFARVALKHAEIARKLKVKKIVIGECGHAHKAMMVIADRLLGPDAVPRESCLTYLDSLLAAGRVKLDPSRNDFPVTLHDPCNTARALGIVEAPRRILRKIAPRFREMTPHGVDNYCCGGGSGFAIMSPNNFAEWRTLVSGRLKLKQVLDAFGGEEPSTPKYVCAPCSNCKGQFRDLFRAYGVWERSRLLYGGLVELIVNAMSDVKPGFIEWGKQ